MSKNASQQQLLIPQVTANDVLVESSVIKDTEDSRVKYRREIEQMVKAKQGEISALDLKILEALRIRLGLSLEEAFEIRNEVLNPYRDYKKRLTEYRKAFVEAIRREPSIKNDTRNGLKRLQELLNLKNDDVIALEAQIIEKRKGSEGNNVLVFAGILSLIFLAGISSWVAVSLLNQQQPLENPLGSEQTSIRG
jgi:hypothetical protein